MPLFTLPLQITPTSYPIYGLVASQLGDVDTPTLLPDGVSRQSVCVCALRQLCMEPLPASACCQSRPASDTAGEWATRVHNLA